MAHEFSVQIHAFLSQELARARERLAAAVAQGDRSSARFQEGMVEELLFFRGRLSESYDLKNQKYF
ncbi:MAG: hypothetical protein AB1634_12140 [Thermodesulfobacteriota bacterium]